MTGPLYAGAYWGARREPSEACAQRLLSCLSGLAEIDDAFARWEPRVTSRRAKPMPPISIEEVPLHALISAGRNRNDFDASVIEELGYSAGLWNGDPRRSSGFDMHCGCFSHHVGNSFTLNLPNETDLSSWLPWEQARRLMLCLVGAWEPQWATLTASDWREAQQPAVTGAPVVGWLTYIAGRGCPQRLPPGARCEAVVGGGMLVSASEDFDEALGQKVASVAAALATGGALEAPAAETRRWLPRRT